MNRRASDSGAHILLFQQQYGVTGSNTFGAVHPTHTQSPSSNVRHRKKERYSIIVSFVLFVAIISRKYYTWCANHTTHIFHNSPRS